jgi:hypothetical protein
MVDILQALSRVAVKGAVQQGLFQLVEGAEF